MVTFASTFWSNTETAVFDDSKVLVKRYKATPETELEIINKHGEILFETWDKDSVVIEVSIKVTSDRLEQIQSLMNGVDVRFMNSTDFISATTLWNTSAGIKMDVTKLLGGQKINVSYKVFLPKSMEINVDNKFGDIVMDDFEGKVKVTLAHGRFVARNLNNLRKMEVYYSKVDIKSCKDADFILKFSTLKLREAKKINIDGVSSDIKVDHVSSATIKALNGDIEIGNVGYLQLSSTMCTIEIEQLSKDLTGEIKLGSLLVEEVKAGFESITLEGLNTDIRLDFDENAGFSYSVDLEKGKLFKIPTNGNKLIKENVLGDFKQYEGTFKSGETSKIKIGAKSSYVTFGIID